ncbi:TIGR04372 family glycosyltransferase [Candidatus Bipolaricaulota bacterium]|nr:TIGR04372 family glycosyltransferase [Candidatus Bipolaricaulota bacterium]
MIASDNLLRWNRFLSPRYLASKVQEKGASWCLRRVVSGVILVLVSIVLGPLVVSLVLARVRFMRSGTLLKRIGHLALEPDCYVKSGLLGWRPRYCGVLLVRGRAVNPCLLHYWSRYIKIVSNPFLVMLLWPLEKIPFLHCRTDWMSLPDRGKMLVIPAVYPIQTKYEAQHGGRPLLTLSSSDYERGWRCLQELGVPQDAWFVCLHVREGGYLPRLAYHSYRDADIFTYLLAVESIVERGGWVIRMGDPTMKPLPRMTRVIDYVHSEVRCDWMDVFCFSQCRFILGTTSGPCNVSLVFGVPCALTNFAPMGHGAFSGRDVWIPKLYRSVSEQRYLTFAEVLKSPLRGLYRTKDFDADGVSLVDNRPEEIRDLAVEMMDRLDGNLHYSAEDERFQRRFKALLEAEPMYGTCARVGRDFLRKYAWLLPDEAAQD